MQEDDDISNESANRPFSAILTVRKTRRELLSGSMATAAGLFFAGSGLSGLQASEGLPLMNFRPVPVAGGGGSWPRISPDYEFQILIPWGEPLVPDGPAFSHPPAAADQALQIGIGHDGMHFFPFPGENEHGLLAINHEYGTNMHILGKPGPDSLEEVRAVQHAHGVSVVEIGKLNGHWQTLPSTYARRIHANTPVRFSGPAADSPLLQNPAGNAPRGTFNNCANGVTPWGTYLTCEENFNGYFGTDDADWQASPAERRYSYTARGFTYDWHRFDPRFDLARAEYRNEGNRFGWVVEIDPWAPESMPVKRTALGRFKHEGAALTESRDGRIVAYMGDDQRFDYIYKFVSEANWRDMRAAGRSPLDHGRLYVARFNDDGSGEWLLLGMDNPALSAEFGSDAEILVHARLAADLAGATPMDRPEWTTVAPGGEVYCSLTNNTRRRAADAVNPLAPNPYGHIIRWRDGDDVTALSFRWDIFQLAAETHGTEASFTAPDGLWADPDGRLFIQTDTDGLQQDGLNNQMLVADTVSGEIRRLFEGVRGDEITGVAMTPDRRTLFCNIQHPGNGDPALTSFPEPFDGHTIPRDATIVITRRDGGIIGS